MYPSSVRTSGLVSREGWESLELCSFLPELQEGLFCLQHVDMMVCTQHTHMHTDTPHIGLLCTERALCPFQVKLRPGFLEPSEKISPTEALVTEFSSDKEEPDMTTETRSLQLYAMTDDVAEGQTGSENDLPFEYRRQVLLTPAEEEQEDNAFIEFAGVCGENNLTEAGPGPSQPPPGEGVAVEGSGLSRPLVQLSLLLSDKPIIIKNRESFDLAHDK